MTTAISRLIQGSPELFLRPARSTDFVFLQNIHRLVMKELVVASLGEWDEEFQQERLQRHFNPATLSIVMVNNQPMGTITLTYDEGRFFVSQFYLDPSVQNIGVGRRVLAHLLEATDRVRGTSSLSVLKGSRAANLYQRLGYVLTHSDQDQDYYTRPLPVPHWTRVSLPNTVQSV